MRRDAAFTLSTSLICTFLIGAGPGWIQPTDGVRLEARDVFFDSAKKLPPVGQSFYVYTSRAIKRAELRNAEQAGLRYLGTVTTNVYVFERRADDVDAAQQTFLATGLVKGTAPVLPIDRVTSEVLPYLTGVKGAPNLPLTVTMWSRATAAEARALVPQAAELRDLPLDPNEAIREECFFRLDDAASTSTKLAELATSPLVASIHFRHPDKLHNDASRALANADALYSAPFDVDGTGVVVGHWDGGRVATSHRDFGSRVTNYESAGVSSHATHTAGTILGDGSGSDAARGFAPAATMVAYDFYNDAAAERRAAKHEHYHEIDNHSWGSTSSNYGSYSGGAQEWDLDSRDVFLLGMKAAGNEGRNNQMVDNNYGFDSLPPDSTQKNNLIIGATADDGDLASFSSRGPTNDGRMKPDLSANGQNLYSTMPSGGYGNMSGTSMATPSATGMVALLAELYKREYGGERLTPTMTRAIMIHTVTDVFHRGPDYRFGWGNADVQAAGSLVLADKAAVGTRLVRGAVRDKEVFEYEMDVAAGSNQAKVTLVWPDAYANSTAQRRLINDLDLELVSPSGQTFYPWTLDPANPFSDATQDKRNDRDNVEQVLVDNPEAGTWTVRVNGSSVPDPDFFVQGYVLATSHSVARTTTKIRPSIPASGMQIPDNDPNGLVIDFQVDDTRLVKSLRVHVEIRIRNRGNIEINLVHPDGSRANLEKSDTSTRRDIYALFPDTRSYDEDVASFFGRPGEGTWKLEIIDATSGTTGTLHEVSLEIDLEGPPPPPPNEPPQANAGPDQTVRGGEAVQLDGSMSSDPDGDTLTFMWQQQSGPSATLTGADTAMPSFTAPAVRESSTMVFRLNVDDGNGGMASDDVSIAVIGEKPEGSNRPPIARVGENLRVGPGYEVFLDASASEDPDGDPITFMWTQTSGPDVVLTNAESAVASFTTPDTTDPLDLVFQVEVTDDSDEVDLASLIVTVEAGAPPPPDKPLVRIPAQGFVTGGCTSTGRTTATGLWLGFALLGLLLLRRR